MEVPGKKQGRRGGLHPANADPLQISLPLPATDAANASASRRAEQHPTIESDRALWLNLVLDAITTLAATGEVFQAHDLVLLCGVPEPVDHHMWGPALNIARAEGLIVAVAAVPSSRPRTAKSLCRLWIGAQHAPEQQGAA